MSAVESTPVGAPIGRGPDAGLTQPAQPPEAASERKTQRTGRWATGRQGPARMLETALQLLESSERSRADTRQLVEACVDAHRRTDALLDELARWLSRRTREGTRLSIADDSEGTCEAPLAPPIENAAVRGEAVARPAPDPRPPSVEIYLLSPFRVFANDRAIDDWPNCKGKSIFKYLVTHRAQPVPKEVLMEVFWRGADPDAARNNLNVAIYGLRRALARADPEFPFVLFRQGCYSFNPDLRLWVDSEAFVERLHVAQVAEQRDDAAAAIAEYRVAQAIYHSPLLVEDRYEDWLLPHRQSLQDSYLCVLGRLSAFYFGREQFEACAGVTGKMLEVDICNEESHRQLMRCYSRMGQTHLALRQYHFCVDALARELNLIPSPQTVALFQQIRRRQTV